MNSKQLIRFSALDYQALEHLKLRFTVNMLNVNELKIL